MILLVLHKKDGTEDRHEFVNETFLHKFLTEYINEYMMDRKVMELQMDIIKK